MLKNSERTLRPHQFFVLDAMRSVGFDTKPFLHVFVILGIISIIPNDFAVAFKCENMCCHAIKKPAIMGDDNRTACKVLQRFF